MLSGHQGHPSTVAFAPDGRTLWTGINAGVLKVWDVASRTQIGTHVLETTLKRLLHGGASFG